MRPQGGSGRLESMTEATWSRGLWHGLGGLPALIQAARAALADSRGRPLSLCIVQLAHPPVPAGENGTTRNGDRGLVGAVNYLRKLLSEASSPAAAGSIFVLRTGEFALLLAGVDAQGRRRLQERITSAVRPEGPTGSPWFVCGGATAPDDGTTLAALWLAADSRRLAAGQAGNEPTDEADWRELLATCPECGLDLLAAFLERVEVSDRLSEHYALLAYTDPLTGLPNQRAVTDLLQAWMASGEAFSILLIDGDELKVYNQRFGYEGGNQMIIHISRALARALPDGAVLARWLSGDEFVVLTRRGDAMEIAVDLCEQVREEFRDWPIPITVSVGVAHFPDHGHDPDSLIRAASLANDEAKRRGKDRVVAARPARRRA